MQIKWRLPNCIIITMSSTHPLAGSQSLMIQQPLSAWVLSSAQPWPWPELSDVWTASILSQPCFPASTSHLKRTTFWNQTLLPSGLLKPKNCWRPKAQDFEDPMSASNKYRLGTRSEMVSCFHAILNFEYQLHVYYSKLKMIRNNVCIYIFLKYLHNRFIL